MSAGSKRHVIAVIDPSESARSEIGRFLQILLPDSQRLEFADSERAITGIRSFSPGLVLVDRIEAVKLLKEFPRESRRFHVIVLSDLPGAGDFETFKDYGADDVCAKPLDELLLKAKIETLLFGLYSSPFSFFGTGSGAGLSAITMSFGTQIYALSETAVEFVSPVILRESSLVSLTISGHALRVRVERCKPNPNRPDSHFVRATYPSDLSAADRAALRRVIADAAFGSAPSGSVQAVAL